MHDLLRFIADKAEHCNSEDTDSTIASSIDTAPKIIFHPRQSLSNLYGDPYFDVTYLQSDETSHRRFHSKHMQRYAES